VNKKGPAYVSSKKRIHSVLLFTNCINLTEFVNIAMLNNIRFDLLRIILT